MMERAVSPTLLPRAALCFAHAAALSVSAWSRKGSIVMETEGAGISSQCDLQNHFFSARRLTTDAVNDPNGRSQAEGCRR